MWKQIGAQIQIAVTYVNNGGQIHSYNPYVEIKWEIKWHYNTEAMSTAQATITGGTAVVLRMQL